MSHRPRGVGAALVWLVAASACGGRRPVEGVAEPRVEVSAESIRTPPPAAEPPTGAEPLHPVWRFLTEKYDADRDGRITAAEYGRGEASYARLDADQDGLVSAADFAPEWTGVPRVEDFRYGEGGPEEGAPAPGFTLTTTDGATVALADYQGEKPVVLVFGSFT